jgi:CoA:oxalate CoA-transferase
LLTAAEVPVSAVNRLDAALADPLAIERELLVDAVGAPADAPPLPLLRLPFLPPDATALRWPPALGADTRAVLEELGLGLRDEGQHAAR